MLLTGEVSRALLCDQTWTKNERSHLTSSDKPLTFHLPVLGFPSWRISRIGKNAEIVLRCFEIFPLSSLKSLNCMLYRNFWRRSIISTCESILENCSWKFCQRHSFYEFVESQGLFTFCLKSVPRSLDKLNPFRILVWTDFLRSWLCRHSLLWQHSALDT